MIDSGWNQIDWIPINVSMKYFWMNDDNAFEFICEKKSRIDESPYGEGDDCVYRWILESISMVVVDLSNAMFATQMT